MSHSTAIVPIVLWGRSAPSHPITIVTCTYDQKTVITGTADGQIGLWDLRFTQTGGIKVSKYVYSECWDSVTENSLASL